MGSSFIATRDAFNFIEDLRNVYALSDLQYDEAKMLHSSEMSRDIHI